MTSVTGEEKSSLICLDASIVIRLVIDNPLSERVESLFEEWQEEEQRLIAPALLFSEVTNALYRYEKGKHLSSEVVASCLEAALALPIKLYADLNLSRKALQIASEHKLRATYDPHYVALAESFGAELWTADSKMVNALADRPCKFRLLK